MNKIKIIADSTCDLSAELIEKYNISTVPLCIVMNDKSYYDGEDVTPDEIFKWANENKTTPKTAAISFDKAEEIIKPFMEKGYDIIFFGISSEMSTTCNVARITAAQNDYDRMFVIDSRNLSTGIGLQVIRAAELANEGKTAEEIVSEIEMSTSKVKASFVVDTLTYLARGGRCNSVTALMANTLKLHPLISVKDGKMGVSKKYMGKIDVALSKYTQDIKEELLAADSRRVFITHSGCKQETIDKVYSFLKELNYFEEIHITRAGGVISSHCGPNTLGILYYER